MTGSRRELGLAVLLCLLGSCVVLGAASRTWVEQTVVGRPPLPDVELLVEGSELAPGVRALALVGLAGVVALLAARGKGRVLVGVLLAACGLAVVVVLLRLRGRLEEEVAGSAPARELGTLALDGVGTSAWLWVCLLGGVVLLLAGVLVAVRGPRWASLSRRYDAPSARSEAPADPTERSLWEALDRGEDPTHG